VSQTKLKRLGFDMSKLQAEPNAKPGVVEKNDNLFSKFEVIEENGKTNGILEALCKDNLAKVLVNSNLAPPSGKTVVYNFDKDPQDAKAAKDGRSAQVRLKAEILAEQHVRLELLYRGTQPAPAQTGVIVKKTSPGVQESTFMAKADLRSGQILILPGPLQIRMEAHNEGVPLISDIPYVGALFRKVKEDRNEVQLLVLVQPEIMPPRAAAAGHRPAESNVQR
jgi:pilus assembly protein CpaC